VSALQTAYPERGGYVQKSTRKTPERCFRTVRKGQGAPLRASDCRRHVQICDLRHTACARVCSRLSGECAENCTV